MNHTLILDISGKILALKGSSYFQEIKNKTKEHATLVSCITANGNAMKHLLILKGQRAPEDIIIPPNIVLSGTQSGWVNTDLKTIWFQLFLEYIGNKDKPKDECETHLLLVDGHNSNWNFDMVQLAKNHNVIIYQFPPHTTHILQPLDNLFFRILKEEIRKAKNTSRFQNVNTKWDLIKFIRGPLYHACCYDTIEDSFRIAGVWPIRYKEECVIRYFSKSLWNFKLTKIHLWTKVQLLVFQINFQH